jgi:hypothetical protein
MSSFFGFASSKDQKMDSLKIIFKKIKLNARPKIGILGKVYLLNLQKREFFFSSSPYFSLARFWSYKLAKMKYGFPLK